MGTSRKLKPRREKKGPAPLCNCPATRERYGKAFPHRAGKVRGCHMGLDGYAAGGVARAGCHCKACEVTNTDREHAGLGRLDGYEETGSPLESQHSPAQWAALFQAHEELNAGVHGPATIS